MHEALTHRLGALGIDVPLQVCDTHLHVYPDAPGRLNPARLDDYRAQCPALGVRRCVFVQPKAHREDARCVTDAMAAFGAELARGIVWDDSRRTDADLERLHRAGVRGVRTMYPEGAAIDLDALHAIAHRVARLGWHLLVQAEASQWPATVDALLALPCPVVIDHMGRLPPDARMDSPAVQALLRFARHGGWIKLSAPYYGTRDGTASFESLAWRVEALLDAGWQRALWGSNWPHVNLTSDRKPDDVRSLESLVALLRTAALARAVLEQNPARLYGFPA